MEIQITARECRCFVAAILLTGSLERAEAAVMDGILSMDLDRAAASVIRSEVSPSAHSADAFADDMRVVASFLPAELQRVLKLAPDLRRYFVLRMLVGMSRERCAAVLNVDVVQMEERTCMAVTQLAQAATGGLS